MSTIQDQLTFLEDELAKLGPGTNPDHLTRIDAELSKIEKVIAKQSDEEDDWDPDDEDDGDDGDGVDSDRHRVRKANDDDEDEDDAPELSTDNNRRRMFNTGEPLHYQDLEKAYSASSSSGSPLPVHHKWEATVQNLANEHGVPKSTAAVMARKQFPRLYQSYQESGLQDNAARSHQSLVTAEMDKGFSEIVAKQRVMHAHGSTPLDIRKFRDSPAVRLENLMTKVMQRTGCERTVAWRAVRKRFPKLMAKFNMMEV
jgi:hypothetical protein